MGSLDAYLVAAGFWLFGQQVWVIRFVQILLYLGTIYIIYKIGIVALNSKPAGLIAALFLAAPPVNVTLYTTISLGGYGEALLLGSLGLFLGFKLLQLVEEQSEKKRAYPFSLQEYWDWFVEYPFG
jgi:4-amino-4-deoxy-L-arabinose transferase-like glycosyltransferase